MVRADYVNGLDDSNGYSYTVRLFGWDQNLTIHARPGYDDVTGVGTPTGSDFIKAVAH